MTRRVPSAVLRNKGVPVQVAIVEDSRRLLADDEGPRITDAWVRFDANAMADLEDSYGSLDGFDEQTRKTPTAAIRRALAICWNVPPRTAGLMMLDGRMDDYAAAISVALALASGVDPQQASDLLEEGVRAVSEAKKTRTEFIKELIREEQKNGAKESQEPKGSTTADPIATDSAAIATGASPGTNGSPDGYVMDATPTSSGV